MLRKKLGSKRGGVARHWWISGFRREVEICSLLGYYAVSSGNPLPTFQDNVSVPFSRVKSFMTLEDGTDTFFRNVGKGLPFDAA